MAPARDIGIDVAAPARECQDPHCPFHGTLPVRGHVIDGQVVSAKMERSVVVRREYLRYMPKYERFEKRTSKYTAHHPPCMDINVGDLVTIMECRPLSKTKHYVIVEARKGEMRITGEDFSVKPETAPSKKAGEEEEGEE